MKTHNCSCLSCSNDPETGNLCAICLGDAKYHWSCIGTDISKFEESHSCHGYCPVEGHRFVLLPKDISEDKLKMLKRLIEIE
jgi:hypothetical protein